MRFCRVFFFTLWGKLILQLLFLLLLRQASFTEKFCTVSWLSSGSCVYLSWRLSLDWFKFFLLLLNRRLFKMFFCLGLLIWCRSIDKLLTFLRLLNLRILVFWLLHWNYFTGLDSFLESSSAVREAYLRLRWSCKAISLLYNFSLLIGRQSFRLHRFVLGRLLFLDLYSFSGVVHPRFISFLKEILLSDFRVSHLFANDILLSLWRWSVRTF